jgi:hypothetical protein
MISDKGWVGGALQSSRGTPRREASHVRDYQQVLFEILNTNGTVKQEDDIGLMWRTPIRPSRPPLVQWRRNVLQKGSYTQGIPHWVAVYRGARKARLGKLMF